MVFVLMIRRRTRSTRTDTRVPYTSVFRSNVGYELPSFIEQSLFNLNDTGRQSMGAVHAGSAMLNGQKGFFQPRFPPPSSILPGSPDTASYYDTAALKDTLERDRKSTRLNSSH